MSSTIDDHAPPTDEQKQRRGNNLGGYSSLREVIRSGKDELEFRERYTEIDSKLSSEAMKGSQTNGVSSCATGDTKSSGFDNDKRTTPTEEWVKAAG